MKKKTSSTNSLIDPVTDYAERVTTGELIAGPDIRNACKRHLKDIKSGHERGIHWDIEKADKAIRYFSSVLKLNGGQYEGKPFVLLPWQSFVVGSLFGWYNEDDTRRFRQAYIETAKGSGKSPLAAGIGLYGLTADGEARAEIYAAATKRDQAMILFRDAVAMVDQSPALSKRLTKSGGAGNVWNLAHLQTGSFFRAISADDSQSGPRPHMALLDEIHEHKNNNVIEMMTAGAKSRQNPLFFMITNSGTDLTSVCYQYHEYGARLCSGEMQNDSFFAFICSLDENDDPLNDESCWYKSNPSLQEQDLPGLKYLREQVTAAKGMPAKESIVRRLNFCQWVGATNPWISKDTWMELKADFDWRDLRGRRAYAGLDLSSTKDLTALVLLVEPILDGEKWKLVPFFWLPEKDLEKRSKEKRVPYTEWKALGYLETTPGAAISKTHILHRLMEISSLFDIQKIAYDRWRIEDLKQLAIDDGVELPEMVGFGQGFKDMAPAVDRLEEMILNKELEHANHPVMNWNINNAVITSDPAGNKKTDKEKATAKMDGVVASVMAAGVINKDGPKPKYQMFFV